MRVRSRARESEERDNGGERESHVTDSRAERLPHPSSALLQERAALEQTHGNGQCNSVEN